MCPGWVKTEMGGPNAIREIEDSADTAIWLATLPDDGPTGGFFKDRKPLPWTDAAELCIVRPPLHWRARY